MRMLAKPAAEALRVSWDFTELLATGDSLSGTPSMSACESGEASAGVTVGTPAISGSTVRALVSGGTAGKLYVVRCACAATGSQALVQDVGVSVIE